MQTYRVKLPRHHPGQQKVVREARRFNSLVCGVRWGKTTFGIDRLVIAALPGVPVAWYAPTNKSLADSWEQVKRVCHPITARKLEQQHKIELVSGGSIEMWSLEDPDASRGRKYKLAVIDEAAHARHLEYAWTRVIRQRLTDYQGGAWFLSTPRGFNYFKRLYDRGQDPADKAWMSWQMPTATNPYISQSEIDDARRDMSEAAFAQEYLAQFVSDEGAVFRFVNDAAVLDPLSGPVKDREYVFGIDWGRSLDYTVVAIIDVVDRAVVGIERWGALEYALQLQRLRVLYDRWNPVVVIAEQNSMGGPICESLQREGMRLQTFNTTNVSKCAAVEGLSLAFENRTIRIVKDDVLISELQGYEGKRSPSGLMQYSAPSGGHDDTVMAVAIGWSVVDVYGPSEHIVVYDDPVRISAF